MRESFGKRPSMHFLYFRPPPRAEATQAFWHVRAVTNYMGYKYLTHMIIKCDGDHSVEVGYHLQCTELDSLPDGDWFCPTCRAASVWSAEILLDKKTMKGQCAKPCVHFKVRWKGYSCTTAVMTRGSRVQIFHLQ